MLKNKIYITLLLLVLFITSCGKGGELGPKGDPGTPGTIGTSGTSGSNGTPGMPGPGTRIVYTGTLNNQANQYISIPEITLDDMPSITLYVYYQSRWVNATTNSSYSLEDGIFHSTNAGNIYINCPYKIVVIK